MWLIPNDVPRQVGGRRKVGKGNGQGVPQGKQENQESGHHRTGCAFKEEVVNRVKILKKSRRIRRKVRLLDLATWWSLEALS